MNAGELLSDFMMAKNDANQRFTDSRVQRGWKWLHLAGRYLPLPGALQTTLNPDYGRRKPLCHLAPQGSGTPRAVSSRAIARAGIPASSAKSGLSRSARSRASSRLRMLCAFQPPSFAPCAFLTASAALVHSGNLPSALFLDDAGWFHWSVLTERRRNTSTIARNTSKVVQHVKGAFINPERPG